MATICAWFVSPKLLVQPHVYRYNIFNVYFCLMLCCLKKNYYPYFHSLLQLQITWITAEGTWKLKGVDVLVWKPSMHEIFLRSKMWKTVLDKKKFLKQETYTWFLFVLAWVWSRFPFWMLPKSAREEMAWTENHI